MVTAYAEIEDVLAFFSTAPVGKKRERLGGLLGTAAEELNEELKRDYYRHPTTGDETWLVDGPDNENSALLHVHEGIVELSLVEISLDRGQTFVELEADGWLLKWDKDSLRTPPEGEPHFHVELRPFAAYTTLPRGTGVVRLTGVRGWPRFPLPLVEGNAERARQIAFADPSYQGYVPTDGDAYGRPAASGRWPDVTWRFIEREKRRFYACEM